MTRSARAIQARRRVGVTSTLSLSGQLHARLGGRRGEIEQAVLTRVHAVSDPTPVEDPTYLEGLKTAVSAAIDYGLAGICGSQRTPPPVPPPVLIQARVAARAGIGLDTILRRYFAGYVLLGDFLVEEAEAAEFGATSLRPLWRVQARNFDRLLTAVSKEYAREGGLGHSTSEDRKAELIERLLAGERFDATELTYDFDGHHVAILAKGKEMERVIPELARNLDRRLLILRREQETTWAWLGGARPFGAEDLAALTRASLPADCCLAHGEVGEGIDGWRFSHRQAKAALPIALRRPRSVVRYADVALVATALKDELLRTSLQRIINELLEDDGQGGRDLHETLKAFFSTGHNVSSTAATLDVTRHTVTNRLRTIESRLGCPLAAQQAEIEVAFRLSEILGK